MILKNHFEAAPFCAVLGASYSMIENPNIL